MSEPIKEATNKQMPNPSEVEVNSGLFKKIWAVMKSWDVNAPEYYSGYCGANGSHVKLILDAIEAAPVLERIKELEAELEHCSWAYQDIGKLSHAEIAKRDEVIKVMRETLTNIATCTRLDGSVMTYKCLPKEAIEALEKADEILKGDR
jgi:hypothetical protein